MKQWATELIALDRITQQLCFFAGDNIAAPTLALAQKWCDTHKPYLTVVGEIIAIYEQDNTADKKLKKKTNYYQIQNN